MQFYNHVKESWREDILYIKLLMAKMTHEANAVELTTKEGIEIVMYSNELHSKMICQWIKLLVGGRLRWNELCLVLSIQVFFHYFFSSSVSLSSNLERIYGRSPQDRIPHKAVPTEIQIQDLHLTSQVEGPKHGEPHH